jgi:hypothetical protein
VVERPAGILKDPTSREGECRLLSKWNQQKELTRTIFEERHQRTAHVGFSFRGVLSVVLRFAKFPREFSTDAEIRDENFMHSTLKYKVLCYLCIVKRKKFMIAKNKRLAGILLTAATLLLLPFLAMQFSNEVKWSTFDFLVAGILLFGTGLLCELAMRRIKTTRQRIVACAVLLLVLFLVWAELAVGVFGTPFAGN